MDQFKSKYLEEATDLISEMEKVLLSLEHNLQDEKLVEQVFRVMHTLKGNSAMFGFDKIGELTHHLETIYDMVRAGKCSLNREILNVTFSAVDIIKLLFEDIMLEKSQNKALYQEVSAKIQDLVAGFAIEVQDSVDSTVAVSSSLSCYYISFKPGKDILKKGNNPLFLLEDLEQTGTAILLPHSSDIPGLFEINPNQCYCWWEAYLATSLGIDEIKDVFIFVEDECEIKIEPLAFGCFQSHEDAGKFFKNIPKSELDKNQLRTKLIAADIMQRQSKEVMVSKEAVSSIRVSSQKLDELMNLVSELVTTQASLNMFAEGYPNPALVTIAENVEKITRQLRDNTFSICLIPIETMLVRFQRLVRDLAEQLGKKIQFITEGTDTELDKTIIENLTDPLMHILRNSIGHGIETPEARAKSGKPEEGKITFRSFYSGNNVVIQLEDDGAGINPEKIRAKAIKNGLIAADANISDEEALNMIFLPGFSTAEQITEVSGRGVGMDVVKKQINHLRGEVEVSSIASKGTTITIKLPLTLSIIDGLLVRINKTKFILPLSAVQKCYEAKYSELENNFGNLLVLDGRQLPFINLRKEFIISQDIPEMAQIILVGFSGKEVGVSVDEIIGEYQAVLKPLGQMYKKQEIFSGATILGDGTIALVLDNNQLIKTHIEKSLTL
jgi:two-component system, chemotaxis family, sensor kinase CheA